MTALEGMKELDGFSFGIKAPDGLQLKGFESILHLIPGLMGCYLVIKKDLVCFDEGHPQNSSKRWLINEIINYYIF